MKVFISYSRHDAAAVKSLADALELAQLDVWLDQELGGGQAWWTVVLDNLRDCRVFILALSDNSLFSKPCRAELDYARALGLPILPVQIGEVASYRLDPIFSLQRVDYRTPTPATGFALMGAVNERAAHYTGLPNPLPEPPPIPYEYLQRLGASIHGLTELTTSVQMQTLFELRTALDEEDDETVREDIGILLRALRRRKDVAYAVAGEIDAILGEASPVPAPLAKEVQDQVSPPEVAPPPPAPSSFVAPKEQELEDLSAMREAAALTAEDPLPAKRFWSPRNATIAGVAIVAVVAAVVASVMLTRSPEQPSAQGPQLVLPFPEKMYAKGVAVDSAGTVYTVDAAYGKVLTLSAGSTSATELPIAGLNNPSGLALDDAGTVYVSDTANQRVLSLTAGATTPNELPFAVQNPFGIAVDAERNVYVADGSTNTVLKLAPGAPSATPLPFTELNNPTGVAVDTAGNVFVADMDGNRVVELPAGAANPTVLPVTGLNHPCGVAVDTLGNLYITDQGNKRVLKVPVGSSIPTVLPFADIAAAMYVAVANGSVYITDSHLLNGGFSRVLKLPPV